MTERSRGNGKHRQGLLQRSGVWGWAVCLGARESPQKSRPEPGNGEKNSRPWLGEKSGRRTGRSLKQRPMPHRRQREGVTFLRFSCKKTGLKLSRGKIENSGHHGHSRNTRIAMVKGGRLANLPNVLRKAPALDREEEEAAAAAAAAAKDDPEGEDARREKRIHTRGKGRPPSLSGIFVCPDIKREEEDQDGEDAELCKKRILMGEKCRPLNSSGYLRYDEYGILIPE